MASISFIFFSALAETNRAPFDLAEAEAELVAGYFIEYSAMAFALFFLGEYSNMLIMCSLIVIFFCGGWFSPIVLFQFPIWFGIKVAIFSFWFVWVRATYPRLRLWSIDAVRVKIFPSYFSRVSCRCC